jgi:hypothetical protein
MSPQRFLLFAALLGGCSDGSSAAPSEDAGRPVRDAGRDARVVDARAEDPTGEVIVRDAGRDAIVDAGALPDAFVELPFGPALPSNPFAAGEGFATQHGDPGASDTTPLPGPGAKVISTPLDLLAVCPSILPRKDGTLFAVCTQIANQTPAVFLIDPAGPRTLASRELIKGDLFGGVYPFLDHEDKLVVVDGANTLMRLDARKEGDVWSLGVTSQVALGEAIAASCGAPACDSVVGLAPDYEGRVWFATARGLVGTARDGVQTLDLGEGVANSIAVAPSGTAVVTERALYLLSAGEDHVPTVKLRAEYDRGTARKPGQLSWGSGSTPTFFGPRTGSEYLAITDNARPTMNLVVYRTDGDDEPVCTFAVPSPAGDGSENSPIGAGRSVIVTSTFGYPYLALPKNAGASLPESAGLTGGMARIDVLPDESCKLIWTNSVRSAAVPKLSTADQHVYTIERKLALGPGTSPFDGYAYTVLDAATGKVTTSQDLPGLTDTMQLAGTVGRDRTFWQGTITGMTRITPAP